MEEKEYNDIESLAAYLHSGKMQALKAESESSAAAEEIREYADTGLFTPEVRQRGRKNDRHRPVSFADGLKAAISEDDIRELGEAPPTPEPELDVQKDAYETQKVLIPMTMGEIDLNARQDAENVRRRSGSAAKSSGKGKSAGKPAARSVPEPEENYETQKLLIPMTMGEIDLNARQDAESIPKKSESAAKKSESGSKKKTGSRKSARKSGESYETQKLLVPMTTDETDLKEALARPAEKPGRDESIYETQKQLIPMTMGEIELNAGQKQKSAKIGTRRGRGAADEAPKAGAEDIKSLSELIGEKPSEAVRHSEISAVIDNTETDETAETEIPEAKNENLSATKMITALNSAELPEAFPEDMDETEPTESGGEDEEELTKEERRRISELSLNYDKQRLRTRTLAYILIGIFLSAAILGAAAYASSYLVRWALDFTGIGSMEFRVSLDIPDDADIGTVAAILADNNIISEPKFFKFYAEFMDKLKASDTNRNTRFIAGNYTVTSTMSYSTLLSMMRSTRRENKTVSVRIVEGMTAREIGELLEENNVCFADDFERYYKNIQNVYDFERRVKESADKYLQLEGYLFPDTYEFYIVNEMENGGKPSTGQTQQEAYDAMKKASEENAKEVSKKIYSNFNEKITPRMYKKMGEMHMTLDEVIALASMVQKEAASPDDMGNVASVFLNRIRHSDVFPYLQSDVTVIYAETEIKPYIKGSENYKQRIMDSYNTYICKGIPAGAICNPGLDAINAIIDSPETPYYYFCANEETGEVYYAQTQEQHEQNLILAAQGAPDETAQEAG